LRCVRTYYYKKRDILFDLLPSISFEVLSLSLEI
jgi:hypothetical protein